MLFRVQEFRCLGFGPGWPRLGFGFEQRVAAAIAFAKLLIDEAVFHGDAAVVETAALRAITGDKPS
jgi:hypothetical protein